MNDQREPASAAIWPVDVPPFDKGDPAFCADPYPTYRFLRENSPVAYLPHLNAWLVTRAADLHAALHDPALGHRDVEATPAPAQAPESERPHPVTALHRQHAELTPLWIVMRNPPDHTRLHTILAPHFAARRLDAVVAAAQTTAQAILPGLTAHATFDLVTQLLNPTAQAAADVFLGVPAQDGARLSRLAHLADGEIDQEVAPLQREAGVMAQTGLAVYWRSALRQPAPGSNAGLVAVLRDAAAQGELSETEAVANLVLIATAAYVNVGRQLANALHALLRFPAQWRLLTATPRQAAVALEEATRYETSTLTMLRRARVATQIGGHPIPRDALVMLGAAATNRDPALHPDPDRLDLTRTNVRHWAFGEGMHFCLGAALGRGVGRAVLAVLATSLPSLSLTAPVTFVPSYIKRIPTALIVTTAP